MSRPGFFFKKKVFINNSKVTVLSLSYTLHVSVKTKWAEAAWCCLMQCCAWDSRDGILACWVQCEVMIKTSCYWWQRGENVEWAWGCLGTWVSIWYSVWMSEVFCLTRGMCSSCSHWSGRQWVESRVKSQETMLVFSRICFLLKRRSVCILLA